MYKPDEIKKGLAYCSDGDGGNCWRCHFRGLIRCRNALNRHSLSYVQQLEGDLAEERELNESLRDKIKRLESRLAQVERERDAAVEDLKLVRCCGTCVNNEGGCQTECYVVSGIPTGWKWRGVCEENTKEPTT